MKLQILQDERFTCRACGACCRKWYPELLPGELEKLQALVWPVNDPLAGATKIVQLRGKSYLARQANGACLFLNESNGLCRIHEQFGFDAKPLNCKVFPYAIKPTFEGEASVIGRFDCPTVRENLGAPHADALPDLRRWASQVDLSHCFDEQTCNNLERDQIEAICEFVGTLMAGFARDDQRAMFIVYLCDLLAQTDVNEIDRAALAAIFPRLKQIVEANSDAPARRPGMFARMAFRTLLGLYMRRDEDVLSGLAGRFGRMIALIKVVMGFGNFRSLGLEHRSGRLRKSRLFKPMRASDPPTQAGSPFDLFWRMIRIRLDSFQFMGKGNSDRDFLGGLRSLALLYPLVRAVAKYSAFNRGGDRIEADDVDYACMVVEHSFGRLPILSESWSRSLETLLLKQNIFTRLVKTI